MQGSRNNATVLNTGTKPTKNSLVVHVPTYGQQKSARIPPTPPSTGLRSQHGGQCTPYTSEQLRNNNPVPVVVAVLAFAALVAGLSAAEEVNPATIPWKHIEAYALGELDQNPFVPGAKIQWPQPKAEKPVIPPEKNKVEPPKVEAKPGVKRKDPEHIADFNRLLPKLYEEELKTATRQGPKQQFEVFLRFDRYYEAFNCLCVIQADSKKYANDHRGDWLSFNIWTVGLMLSPPLPKGALDKPYQEWEQKVVKQPIENGGWHQWYKQRKEYWADRDKIKEQLQDLERQGESDGEALWTLANLYNQQRPPSNVQFALALYRLQEWFPEYQQVKNGNVQWFLIARLEQFHLWEQVVDAANLLMERWPHNGHSKDGDAAWRVAHAIKQQAYKIGKTTTGYEKANLALQAFQNFQRKYPGNYHNEQQKHNLPGSTNCKEQISELDTWIPASMKK